MSNASFWTYFFPARNNSFHDNSWVSDNFRKIWKNVSPCHAVPYALRHHYATTNINNWINRGMDFNSKLLYLSKSMGHSVIESTAYYYSETVRHDGSSLYGRCLIGRLAHRQSTSHWYGARMLKLLERQVIEEWILWLKNDRKNSSETCNNRLASIRAFIKYLSETLLDWTVGT